VEGSQLQLRWRTSPTQSFTCKQTEYQQIIFTLLTKDSIYFLLGLVSGSIVTTIGPKITFLISTFGYPFFVGSFWYFDARGGLWFPCLAAAVLGFCAALLWTAAGYIAFSYPEENKKGSYIAMQWGTLAVGSKLR
jgi:MFS family permease